jgi:probable HAF family extracellular repeat protein
MAVFIVSQTRNGRHAMRSAKCYPMQRDAFIAATAAWLLPWLGATDATAAQFIGLGDFPGGRYISVASDVSADGSIVVGRSAYSSTCGPIHCTPAFPVFRAFRWTDAGEMDPLPGNWAKAISDDGSTVVGVGAFRWQQSTGSVSLGEGAASADAVSADGSVIVGYTNSPAQAFRWTDDSGIMELGNLPGHSESFARGVSADGTIIVGSSHSDLLPREAFRWSQATGMVGLGNLPGGAGSEATAVSADGSVVVGQGTSSAGQEAFRWTQSTGIVGLGDLPGGSYSSSAADVLADGSIVVGQASTDIGPEAFIWDAGMGIRNLRDVLVDDFGLDASLAGWTLRSANGISADGRVIVGSGNSPRGIEAWIARLDASTALPGDYNEDSAVDAADYVVWRKGFGTVYTQNDYDVWRAHFGRAVSDGWSAGSGSAGYPLGASAASLSTPAPEPGLLILSIMMTLLIAMHSSWECRGAIRSYRQERN